MAFSFRVGVKEKRNFSCFQLQSAERKTKKGFRGKKLGMSICLKNLTTKFVRGGDTLPYFDAEQRKFFFSSRALRYMQILVLFSALLLRYTLNLFSALCI